MNPIDNSEPAFPTQDAEVLGGVACGKPGMSLRDWFAGMAIQGQMSIPDERTCPKDRHGEVEKWRNELIAFDAEFAYLVADAMIEARKKTRLNP